MKSKATTVSRRHMLASIPAAAMVPAVVQANAAPAPLFATTDPVFAAIERHRQAAQAWLKALDDAGSRAEEDAANAMLGHVDDALVDWLTTQPTTIQGVIATLEHASRRPDDEGNGDHIHTHLGDTARRYLYGTPASDVLKAAAAFAEKVPHWGLPIPARERHIRPLLADTDAEKNCLAMCVDGPGGAS
jgi:hypothetical protein